MHFGSKRLKSLFQRSPCSLSAPARMTADEGGSKPSSERHKRAKMKSAKRTASAVASHSFDVMREVSDVFGPLKSVVNGVGHVSNVLHNARKSQKGARALHSEVNTFRAQVDTMIPDVSLTPIQVINSLVRLDGELDNIEAITSLLSQGRLGSRILHWKERDEQLRTAELRFRGARERFSIECSIAATVLPRPRHIKEVRSLSLDGSGGIEKKTEGDMSLESVKVLTLLTFGLFGSYGSMGGPVIISRL